jgi:hypothetical protein
MNIYKLQYTDKAEGDADLLAKGTYEVIEGEQVYRNGTQAIVFLNKIVENLHHLYIIVEYFTT